ncbi:MAG: hypothetical protein F9K19_17560 [Rhizobiaceae bacterium]|nr:MAG: hypothetical protein F9K19_17560 [Rhizobiaceae bacterium]CAG1007586.1 hypothetical protein RHIZO_03392 [Rhizobiaceae bacterium]
MAGAVQDRGTFPGIARTLLALALLAERAASRSFPVRFLVLVLLGRAEVIARRFVARSTATVIAEAIAAGCPCPDLPDLACLDEPTGLHYGAADAVLLALRLRILAAVLGVFSDADDIYADQSASFFDDRSTGWPTDWRAVAAPGAGGTPTLPLLLVVRLPASRRPLRLPDTS